MIGGPAFHGNVSVPLADPIATGENSTVMAQLCPGRIVGPHVFKVMLKPVPVVNAGDVGPTTTVPLLNTVSVAELREPTFADPMSAGLGVMMRLGPDTMTVPVRLALAVAPGDPDTVRLAPAVPETTGLNVTLTWQLAPAARVDPHVVVPIANSAACGPINAIVSELAAAAPVLLTVSVLPVVPPSVVLNVAVAGVIDSSAEVVVPVPEIAADAVAPTVDATICALFVPADVGAKYTVPVHVAPGASGAPQVLPTTTKLLTSVPVIAGTIAPVDAVPVFVTVNVFDADCDPTAIEPKSHTGGVIESAGAPVSPLP